MSAYWISVYKEIVDDDKVSAYAELAGPALTAAGGTFLARGTPEQTYESGEVTRTVLIEFDSVEAARAAHASPPYPPPTTTTRDMAVTLRGAAGFPGYPGKPDVLRQSIAVERQGLP